VTDTVEVTASEPVPVLTDLSAREQELVQAARHGDVVVCGDLSREVLARSTNPEYRIRARLIRELLLGRHGDLDPRGVRVQGARIVGQLDLDYVDTTVGLDLVGCACTDPVTAQHAQLPRLTLTQGIFEVLHADGLHVDGDLNLCGARFVGSSELGTVSLHSAHIGGQFAGVRMRCDNNIGIALDAENLRADGGLFLREGRFTGSSELGTVRLVNAQLGSQFAGERMRCHNNNGPALHADNLRVDGNLVLKDARFTGTSASGTVRLHGGHIGGQFAGVRMQCDNNIGIALDAENLRADGGLFLADARFTGSSKSGTVRLLGAQIGSTLDGEKMRCTNDIGPALHADGVRVDGNLALENAQFTGSGVGDAVHLPSARVDGQLNFYGTKIFNGKAPGLQLQEVKATGAVVFPAQLVCPQPWGRSCPRSRGIVLKDFTFGSLTHIGWPEWLHLVRFHTTYYSPSPYQHLAAVERAAGHDGNARRILIAQQQDLLRRTPWAVGGRMTRGFHRLWGALAGYGYRTRRTAGALLLALTAAALLGLWAGHVHTPSGYAAERTTTSGTPGLQCSPVELIGLGLDRGLPLAPTGLRTRCDLDTTTTPGQLFTLAVWLVQSAVWGLATLALAGYTGLVRKTA
jgi:hypothetical protein